MACVAVCRGCGVCFEDSSEESANCGFGALCVRCWRGQGLGAAPHAVGESASVSRNEEREAASGISSTL